MQTAVLESLRFNASAIDKFNYNKSGEWRKSDALGDLDTFALSLTLEGMYTNKSVTQILYIKWYEGEAPNERFITYKEILISLPACQGLEADIEAEAAGGEFVLDADGECQWSGAWTFVDGEWQAPQSNIGDGGAQGSLDGLLMPALVAFALIVIVILTLFLMRRGSEECAKQMGR